MCLNWGAHYGSRSQCRGGAEAAPFFEWGGRDSDGSDGFKRNRPGWPTPIHQLLVQNHVNIVYQEVPQPGDPRGNTRSAAEYGYKSGTILGSSGHLRVVVSTSQATVDYIHTDRSTAHSYSIASRSNP